jgi:hypothetical protein
MSRVPGQHLKLASECDTRIRAGNAPVKMQAQFVAQLKVRFSAAPRLLGA